MVILWPFCAIFGEFWSVKFIETSGLKKNMDPSKQSLKNQNTKSKQINEVSYWTVYNSFNSSFFLSDICQLAKAVNGG